MSNIINGSANPRFRILSQTNDLIEEIDLRQTNSNGLIETTSSEDITHILEKNKRIVKVYRGTRITFTLNYDQFIQQEDLLKLYSILNYERNGFKIILLPRSDILSRSFQVTFTGDSFDLGINKGGAIANSHKLIVMKWETVELVSMNWIDPDNIFIAFQNFAVI